MILPIVHVFAKKFGMYVRLVLKACKEKLCVDRTNRTIAGVFCYNPCCPLQVYCNLMIIKEDAVKYFLVLGFPAYQQMSTSWDALQASEQGKGPVPSRSE